MNDTTGYRRLDYVGIKRHGAAPVVTLGFSTEGYPDDNGNPTLEPNSCTMGDMGSDLPSTELLAQEALLRLAGSAPVVTKIKPIFPRQNARSRNGLTLQPSSIQVTVLIPKGECLEKDLTLTVTMAIPGQETNLEGSGPFATKIELEQIAKIFAAVDGHNIQKIMTAELPTPYQQLSLLPAEDPNRESINSQSQRKQLEIASADTEEA
jgi:hypothetical protein